MSVRTDDEPDRGGSTAEALRTIDDTQRRAARSLRPSPLGLFLPWGVGYLVGFGAVWLGIQGVLPGAVVVVAVVASAVGAVGGSVLTLWRSARGVTGPSARVGAMYGWSWFLGFGTIAVVNTQLERLGVPEDTMSLVWSATALLVVGLLYLAGGALFDEPPQYVLGVWLLVSAVLAVLVGHPTNFLILALAGGGGFIALGAWSHRRACR